MSPAEIRFTLRITGTEEVLRRLTVAPQAISSELGQAVAETADEIVFRATGLSQSTRVARSLRSRVDVAALKATVRAGFPARFVEHGRPAGKMPPSSRDTRAGRRFRAWAKRRGINPFLAARAVGRKGVPARPFFQPAIETEQMPYLDRMRRAITRALDSLRNR